MVNKKGFEIETTTFKVINPKLNIQDNYNDDFIPIHATILKRLLNNNDKGFVLLFGKMGTGKTTYIRHLITLLKKKVFFIPLHMVRVLTEPEYFDFLLNNKNSVFIIEDIDNLDYEYFWEKDNYFNFPISNLLNITDGMLSDCLHIQIICTFNSDSSNSIKKSLPGSKLISQYEFKELETNKSQSLSNKLGLNVNVDNPMSLEEIYSSIN